MKSLFALLVFIFSLNSYALKWQVMNPCKDEVEKSGLVEIEGMSTVGKVSIDAFEQAEIDYVGAEKGMNSILEVGNTLEVIRRSKKRTNRHKNKNIPRNTQMRSYGWCYAVNGEVSQDKKPNQFAVSNTDTVTWFYAFSWYDRGWKEMCVPAHTAPAKFCK